MVRHERSSDHPSLDVVPYRSLLKSGSWEDRRRLVMALYASGRGEALPILRQALQDPDERIRLLAAQALERLGESTQKAVHQLRRAAEQHPGDSAIKVALARLLFDQAKWSGRADDNAAMLEECARLLSVAVSDSLGPMERSSAWAFLGRINAQLGRTLEARRCFDQVSQDSPDYFSARLLWAESWIADGDPQAAKAEMARLAQAGRSHPAIDAMIERNTPT